MSSAAAAGRAFSVVLLVRALGFGGTERQVVALAHGLASRHKVTVASFYPGGPFEAEFAAANPERLVIGKQGRGDVVGFCARLRRALSERRPDIVYSFLPVPNLLAAMLAWTSYRRPALVWGIRGTPLELARYDWLERASIQAERMLSRVPDLLIANSRSGAEWARACHAGARRIEIVPNGIDTDRFRPATPAERMAARRAFGCPERAVVAAVVGRLDPMKDHRTFLQGLASAVGRAPNLMGLIAGEGAPGALERLKATASALGIADRVIWTGARRDVAEIYRAADLLCLPSAFGEGFPNVVGEAMASGLPCIVTAVGDSPELVGGTGIVVPPRRPEAMAEALIDCAARIGEIGACSSAGRQRIIAQFGLEPMISKTETLLRQVLADRL
jgi:glycosyltransferase involved in cell wall biosynthesis